jgi:hypothetical protein
VVEGIECDAGALTRRVERVDLSRWERRTAGILRFAQNDKKDRGGFVAVERAG